MRIANSTVYGLAGAAWTSNLSRAHRMLRRVRTGVMHISIFGGADGTDVEADLLDAAVSSAINQAFLKSASTSIAHAVH